MSRFLRVVYALSFAISGMAGCSAADTTDGVGVSLNHFQQGLLDQVQRTLRAKDPFAVAVCKPNGTLDAELVEVFKRQTTPLVNVNRRKMALGDMVSFDFSRLTKTEPIGIGLAVLVVDGRCDSFWLSKTFFDPPFPQGAGKEG